MTKDEAIAAMKRGEKVAHSWFSPEEWVMLSKHGNGGYEFEDGCRCSVVEFWSCRNDESWQKGWSIFK